MKGKERRKGNGRKGDERKRGDRDKGEMVKKEEHGKTKGIESSKEGYSALPFLNTVSPDSCIWVSMVY